MKTASLATNNRARRFELTFEHHTAINALADVVVDVALTPGTHHDTKAVEAELKAIQGTTGVPIGSVTMDASCAKTRIIAALEQSDIKAVVLLEAERSPERGTILVWPFELNAKHRIVRCRTCKISCSLGMPDSDGVLHDPARMSNC